MNIKTEAANLSLWLSVWTTQKEADEFWPQLVRGSKTWLVTDLWDSAYGNLFHSQFNQNKKCLGENI